MQSMRKDHRLQEHVCVCVCVCVCARECVCVSEWVLCLYHSKCIQLYRFFRISQAVSNLIMDHLHVVVMSYMYHTVQYSSIIPIQVPHYLSVSS